MQINQLLEGLEISCVDVKDEAQLAAALGSGLMDLNNMMIFDIYNQYVYIIYTY